jgi:hypothetical protein
VGLSEQKNDSLAPFTERRAILARECVRLWYYPELGIVHHQMVRTPPSEEFRELLTSGAELLERHHARKWLSDDRGNIVLRDYDEEWSQREWLPRVVTAGFKYWAIVLPEAAIGKLNMRRLASDHARRGIESRFEATPEEAFRWLRAK